MSEALPNILAEHSALISDCLTCAFDSFYQPHSQTPNTKIVQDHLKGGKKRTGRVLVGSAAVNETIYPERKEKRTCGSQRKLGYEITSWSICGQVLVD